MRARQPDRGVCFVSVVAAMRAAFPEPGGVADPALRDFLSARGLTVFEQRLAIQAFRSGAALGEAEPRALDTIEAVADRLRGAAEVTRESILAAGAHAHQVVPVLARMKRGAQ